MAVSSRSATVNVTCHCGSRPGRTGVRRCPDRPSQRDGPRTRDGGSSSRSLRPGWIGCLEVLKFHAPGTLVSCAPGRRLACHSRNWTPVGSTQTAEMPTDSPRPAHRRPRHRYSRSPPAESHRRRPSQRCRCRTPSLLRHRRTPRRSMTSHLADNGAHAGLQSLQPGVRELSLDYSGSPPPRVPRRMPWTSTRNCCLEAPTRANPAATR